MCLYITCIWCTQKTEEGGDPLELEVWVVVGHHVGAGDWARSFGKAASALNWCACAGVRCAGVYLWTHALGRLRWKGHDCQAILCYKAKLSVLGNLKKKKKKWRWKLLCLFKEPPAGSVVMCCGQALLPSSPPVCVVSATTCLLLISPAQTEFHLAPEMCLWLLSHSAGSLA